MSTTQQRRADDTLLTGPQTVLIWCAPFASPIVPANQAGGGRLE